MTRERSETIKRIADTSFQVCVIGGGATGSGCALDAALRKLKTVLLEASDFGSGTSSASTKLIHGKAGKFENLCY
jgi:glycerol-3-phosphate dehydrogenase